MRPLSFSLAVIGGRWRGEGLGLIRDQGGGGTSSNLLPVSAVPNLASSNGQLANGWGKTKGQQQTL